MPAVDLVLASRERPASLATRTAVLVQRAQQTKKPMSEAFHSLAIPTRDQVQEDRCSHRRKESTRTLTTVVDSSASDVSKKWTVTREGERCVGGGAGVPLSWNERLYINKIRIEVQQPEAVEAVSEVVALYS